MRTRLLLFVLALLASVPAQGQAIRFDSASTTVNASCVSGKQCPLLALPGTRVNFCQGTPSTLAGCLGSPATTYTDASAVTPCATTSQLTPAIGGACLSTADAQGNYGAWLLPGSYGYYLRIPATAGGGTYGPYPFTVHGDSGGYTLDSLYTSLSDACTAAGSGTLAITKVWNATPTQSMVCSLWYLGNGKIVMSVSAVLTVNGTITAPPGQWAFDSTTNAGASVIVTGPGDLEMGWWGADPTFTVESGTRIQAALNATTAGQTLRCARGIYKVSTALNLLSYTNWLGSPTDLQSGSSADGGCMLKWAGAAPAVAYATGSAIVNIHGKNGTKLSGINLDGANTTNLTGYMVDAFAGGTSQRNAYEKGLIQHFGTVASDIAGAGMSFGDNDIIGGEQVDGVTASQFYIFDAYIGVRIKNANFAYGQFRNFAIAGINKGFDCEYCGYHTVDNGSFGTMQGSHPSVILINGPHGPVTYRSIQAELDLSPDGDAKFFNIAGGINADVLPIKIEGSIMGFPSVVSGSNQVILSKGNFYVNLPWDISGGGVFVTSEGDYQTNPVITGVNSNWKYIGADPAGGIQAFETNYNVTTLPIVRYKVRATATNVTEPYNLFEGLTAQKWKQIWSDSIFGIRDVTASNFLGFSIDKGLSGLDGIFIHPGYSRINAVAFQGVASNPLPGGNAGIWALTGVGSVIQGRLAITSLPLGCSGAPTGFLYQDASGFVKACP